MQTFKEHMIDGETLPLLSEEHLLDTMGLKLGPALKIRSQVRQHGSVKTLTPMKRPFFFLVITFNYSDSKGTG